MTEQFVRKMEEGVKPLGIQLSEKQLEQFYDYFQFLVEKNKVMNLTAITEEDAVITKHFCDSLCLVKGFSDIEKTVSLIDVGTGAGFPGIPLKIAFPHLKVTLLDSLNKRVRFLEEVCERLDLENVTCVHARAEDGGRNKDLREKIDLCVSRAVANLSSLSEYCMPFVKVGGYFIPYKSGDIEEGSGNIRRRDRKCDWIGASGRRRIQKSDQNQENETDFSKISKKSGTSRKRATGNKISMKPVTCR